MMLPLLLALAACRPAPADVDAEGRDSPEDTSPPEDSPSPDNLDQDGDGWTPNHGDCDDQDASVHPGAVEVPDGIDQDCDGIVDEGTEAYDDDGDSRTELQGDCDDSDPFVYFGATDYYPCDGVDQDCDGLDEPCDSLDDAFVRVMGGGALAIAVEGGTDFTGDGQPDLLTFNGNLSIWALPEDGGSVPYVERAAVFNAPGNGEPDGLALLGDVDSDEREEVVIGTVYGGHISCVYIISAPLNGYLEEDSASATLTDSIESSDFGYSVSAGVDASGDGIADILIGAPGDSDNQGRAYLVSGDVRGLVGMDNPLALFTGDHGDERVGHTVRFSGDNNGDGADDLLLGASGFSNEPSKVSWFAGPVSGTLSISDADVLVRGENTYLSPQSASGPGDLNGDGREDLLLFASLTCQSGVYVFTEGLSASPDDAVARFDGEAGCTVGISDAFGAAGAMVDVNRDGLDDLVFGAPQSPVGGFYQPESTTLYTSGAAALFLAPFSGTRSFWEADRVWAGQSSTATLGYDVANLGDVNADGFEDFALAAPYHGDPEVPQEAFLGAAYLMLGQDTW